MSTTTPNVRNGVDVDQLVETIGHIEQQPDLARFQFRARTEWAEGGHARTTIKDFFGAGQEDESRDAPFVLEGDEPPVLLGSNQAPNAVEALLHALGSC
ncbi:MAG: OsmC family protein, partial [Gemmatimonadota bacterium]